jgi:parallel beta-helix repeat protein
MQAKHLRPGRLHRLTRRPSITRISTCLLLFVLLSMVIGPVWSLGQSSSLQLLVSRFPDRSQAVKLDGQSLNGPVYVFVPSRRTITQVAFGLDGSLHSLETSRPSDFNGTADDGTARPWSPTAGEHTITAKITLSKGNDVQTLSATFSALVQLATTTTSTSGPTTTTLPTTTTAAPTTTTAPAAATASCTGVRVSAGNSVQAAIDSNPNGTTFCLGAGIHRLSRALVPKAGQRLIGEPGAILNGAIPVTSFSQTGTTAWVARGVLPTAPSTDGECLSGYSGCKYSEAVFYDGRPLWRVMSLSGLGPGKFYQDYQAGALYIADDPAGHQVEVARAKGAINAWASGVTVQGLVVEKFANDAQRGAIIGGSYLAIERNEVRLNHGVGIQTGDAQQVRVLGNHVHHNGQLGIAGSRTTGARYEGNELAFNNLAGFSSDWEAGGGKWTRSQGLTMRDNHVHHNKAVGLWSDIDTKDVTIEGNRIEANESDGIRYEISYRAVIRSNTITGNGFKDPNGWVNGAGIMVSSASDVEVAGNVVDSNFNGISLRQDDRGSGSLGPYVVENTWVHNNQVIMRRGTTGLSSTVSDGSVFTTRDNRFEDNQYTVAGTDPTNFAWREAELTWTQWQQYGNDLGGSFTRR